MDEIASGIVDIGIETDHLWNTDLVGALELENLMGQALVTFGLRVSVPRSRAMRRRFSGS